jgi:hypothetical protein
MQNPSSNRRQKASVLFLPQPYLPAAVTIIIPLSLAYATASYKAVGKPAELNP